MEIKKENNLAEIICFALYCIGVILITIFHEPWYDELQAWAISKASIHDILFFIPHYEGHPPLWHLILKIFSSLNFNPEIGIRIPNLLFMFGAVWLLIFKSPFPKAVKLTLPFTFFLFYQYGVLSRPYSIYCFAIFLTAYLYKSRNEHPYKFVSALGLLCLSCAFGMAVSTGIIIAWGLELLSKQNIIDFFKTFVKTSTFKAMLLIFFLCLILTIEFIPAKDTFATNYTLQKIDYNVKFIYSFFIFSADSLIYNFLNYQNPSQSFTSADILDFFTSSSYKAIAFWIGAFCGLLINILFIRIFKDSKKLLQFILPFICLCSTVFLIYAHPHHIGLLTIFYIFAFWTLYPFENNNFNKNLKKIFSIFITIVISIQLFWTFTSCMSEYLYQYSASRAISNFIKKNNLQNYKIMCPWYFNLSYINKKTGKNIYIKNIETEEDLEKLLKTHDEIITHNLASQSDSLYINTYFNKNIVDYYNVDNPERIYILHKYQSKQELAEYREIMRNIGLPDIVVGKCHLRYIFPEIKNPYENYVIVSEFKYGQIWKNTVISNKKGIFIKKDLLKNLEKEK